MSGEADKTMKDTVHDLAHSEEGSTTVVVDAEVEKRLLRKLDWHILPFVFITYLFSFLDRINIGNAKTAGLPASLHLQGNQINGTSRPAEAPLLPPASVLTL